MNNHIKHSFKATLVKQVFKWLLTHPTIQPFSTVSQTYYTAFCSELYIIKIM